MIVEDKVSQRTASASDGEGRAVTPGKKLKRFRKPRNGDTTTPMPGSSLPQRPPLTGSTLYLSLLLLRAVLIFAPGNLENSEYQDGVDVLAASLLPGMPRTDPALISLPEGMSGQGPNITRSIVGAVISSGIPYAFIAASCKWSPVLCPFPDILGAVAIYLPRVWMFLISLVTDALLYRTFAVYESEHAVSAVVMFASTWTTLVGATRNVNFALEAMCLTAILAGCFGWPVGTARPLFWLSGSAIALATFLRPINFLFILTPIIYLSSLWGKNVSLIRYLNAALEGIAIFAAFATVFVSIDSFFFGTFKLRVGDEFLHTFDDFLTALFAGDKMTYKGSLIYTPLNAAKETLTRKYIRAFAHNTTPGQMFLSLPGILGPLFIVLMRESYKGMVVAMKELMAEVKAAANTKKKGKKKNKKNAASKEREEELMVFFDTIQTTFLLGLLMEVMQNNERLGIISLMSLVPPAVMCMPGTVFGEKSSRQFRLLHAVFTSGMVLFFGVMNQAGVQKMLLDLGRGALPLVRPDAHVVVYRGMIGHRAALGPNPKNITVHDGGDTRIKLMELLRKLKEAPEYTEDSVLVAAAGTVEMKEHEFAHIGKIASAHMSNLNVPQNVDDMLKKCGLALYKFVGDEDEAIMKDMEEAEELEAREQERKRSGGAKDEL